jgi:hypothetical protein
MASKYGKSSQKTVKSAMHRMKKGTLKSGRGGKAGTVKNRKQAIAIGLSEARSKGAKVPSRRGSQASSRSSGNSARRPQRQSRSSHAMAR